MGLLRHLSFYEKVEYAKALKVIARNGNLAKAAQYIRNRCAHQLFLHGEKGKLEHENQDMMTVPAFQKFAEKQFEMEHKIAHHIFHVRGVEV